MAPVNHRTRGLCRLRLEFSIHDIQLDGVTFDAVSSHCFSRFWRFEHFHECIEVCWFKTAGHRVVFLDGNAHGCGDRLASKESTMGPKTLFPTREIFYFGGDDDFWQRFSP